MAPHDKAEFHMSHGLSQVEEKSASASASPRFDVDNGHHAAEKRCSVDEAYEFLRQVDAAPLEFVNETDPRALRRKIDKRILPTLWFLFFFHYLDKYLLSYAMVMGLPEDLDLRGNQLNNCISAVNWSFLTMTAFVPLALNKLPIGKWVGFNVICWGGITACVAAVQGYGGLLTCRILLGVFDASIPPALMLISSQYYRKDEQALRFAFWFSGFGAAIMTGGLVSFGFQNVHTDVMVSWRIMFLTIGLLSAVAGVAAVLYVPDTPMNARFLSTIEKKMILQHVAVNQTGISNRHFEISHLKAVFVDPQIWLLFVCLTVVAAGSSIIATYGTTIIRGFGYTSKEAALLNMPGGLIGFVTVLFFACLIRFKILLRTWSAIIVLSLALTGACLVAFISRSNSAGQLCGLYMVTFSPAAVFVMYQWLAANVAGHTKRSISTVLVSAAVSLGSIIGPYAMRAEEAPNYHTGKVVLVSSKATGIAVISVLGTYYLWTNKRRDRLYGVDSEEVAPVDNPETWANLTDQERKSFRYVL